MKLKKITEKAAALSMATAMLASVCAPTYTAVLSAVPVSAASSKDTTNNTATTKDLANADIIDTSKTGSITVHKYDITSAEAAGDYTEGQYKATGESDNRVENALADYAIQGVQFTYLRVGNIEQYSKTDGTGSNIKVVYEIPTALAQILKLNEADATVMTGDGVSAPCTNAGVLHYTSTQIEDALAAIIKADDVAAKNALESYLIDYKDQNKDSDDVQTADTGVIETDANGLATKSGLPLGLYLMVETKVPEQVTSTVNPWFISLPFTNTAADTNTNTDHAADGVTDSIGGEKWLYDFVSYPKNQTGNPTIDKAVRNAYSSDAKDRNGVVTSSKDTNYSGANDSKSLIVYNADTAAENKADTTDAAYVANRGGYTSANNTEAGKDGKGYSNDFKYDDTTTASEGDLLDYRVVSKLPHITSKATYLSQYTFTDALSTGVNYNKDFKIAFYDNAADAKANNTKNAKEIWNLDGGKHEAAYATVTVSGEDGAEKVTANKATITLTEAGLNQINGTNVKGASNPYEAAGDKTAAKAGYSDYYMVLYYTATVNSDASVTLGDSGNANDISLVWSRTNNKYSNSLQDRNYVYSYGIDLTKTFSDNKGDATKVKFVIQNKSDNYYLVAKADSDGVYQVTGKSATEEGATQFSPASSGKLIINGIEGDEYGFTETHSDAGYTLLKKEIIVKINSTKADITPTQANITGIQSKNENDSTANDGVKNGTELANDVAVQTTGASATVDSKKATMSANGESVNAFVDMEVTNQKQFLLPMTGGAGSYALIIAGVVIAGCGFMIVKKNQKRKEVQ